MRKTTFAACFALCLALFVGVCGAGEKGSVAFLDDSVGIEGGAFLREVPEPSRRYQIANITRTLMNTHWVKNKDGFEAASKRYGIDGAVFAVQSEQDVMSQANILDTIIERKFDAIVVSPITEQNLLPGLGKASAAGIVVINVDTAEILENDARANDIVLTSYIGSNNYDAGVIAAEFMSRHLGSKGGEVAIIEGNPGDTCAIDRTSGFADKAKELPNLTLVASQTAKWDRLQALEVATGILRANPGVRGIYCNNDTMVLGAVQAAADLGYTVLTSDNLDRAGEAKTLMLIGNDGVPEALEAIRDGELTGTIAQKPYLMGYAAVEAAIIRLEGKTPDARIATPIKLVVKSDYQ